MQLTGIHTTPPPEERKNNLTVVPLTSTAQHSTAQLLQRSTFSSLQLVGKEDGLDAPTLGDHDSKAAIPWSLRVRMILGRLDCELKARISAMPTRRPRRWTRRWFAGELFWISQSPEETSQTRRPARLRGRGQDSRIVCFRVAEFFWNTGLLPLDFYRHIYRLFHRPAKWNTVRVLHHERERPKLGRGNRTQICLVGLLFPPEGTITYKVVEGVHHMSVYTSRCVCAGFMVTPS